MASSSSSSSSLEPPRKAPRLANCQSLIYDGTTDPTHPTLKVLDQLLIPHEKVYLPVPDAEMAWTVICTMQIRGAPLIAIVALLGLSIDLHCNPKTVAILDGTTSMDQVLTLIRDKMAYLKTSRPTAVNLSNALQELDERLEQAAQASDSTKQSLLKVVKEYSEFMLERDVSDNKAIGKFGAEAILNKTGKTKVNLVTICNTGSLATAGYGTALGIARRLHELDALESISALETRPYNQGSRLTAFEIMEEGMPGGQLICDSSAGALMQVSKTSFILLTWRWTTICVSTHSFYQSIYKSDQTSGCGGSRSRSRLC